MKVSELRIGNILKEGVVSIIEQNRFWITEHGGHFMYCNQHEEAALVKDINPEPITEDFLKKIDKPMWLVVAYDQSIGVAIGMYCECGDSLDHIRYVHQLQNLYFAIEDKELIIKP
jgi:hypothetical protein